MLKTVLLGLSLALYALAADLSHGIQLYQEGKYSQAESELTQVTAQEPENARAARFLGLSRVEQHKPQEAQEILQKADALEPSGETKLALARLYIEDKSLDKAEAALAESSGDELDYVRGLLDLNRGNNNEAAKNLEAYLQTNPNHAYAHYYAGMAYNGAKRPDKMLTHFNLFVKLKPDAPEARKVRAVLQTGR